MTRLNSSGCPAKQRWEASSMITSCEPAIRRCISSRWPGRAFVVTAADEQRADADLRQPVHDVPGLQGAGDGELARAVHRVVDVVACLCERRAPVRAAPGPGGLRA